MKVNSDKVSYEAQYYDVVADIAVNDVLTISPKVGMTKARIEDDMKKIDSKTGSNFGVDVKIKLYEGDVNAVLLSKYRFSKITFKDTVLLKTSLHEYEVGPIISKSFGKDVVVSPYVGCVYSEVKGRVIVSPEKVNFDAKDNIGLRLGTAVKLANNINFFIDGALFDKQGISAKVTYTF